MTHRLALARRTVAYRTCSSPSCTVITSRAVHTACAAIPTNVRALLCTTVPSGIGMGSTGVKRGVLFMASILGAQACAGYSNERTDLL